MNNTFYFARAIVRREKSLTPNILGGEAPGRGYIPLFTSAKDAHMHAMQWIFNVGRGMAGVTAESPVELLQFEREHLEALGCSIVESDIGTLCHTPVDLVKSHVKITELDIADNFELWSQMSRTFDDLNSGWFDESRHKQFTREKATTAFVHRIPSKRAELENMMAWA